MGRECMVSFGSQSSKYPPYLQMKLHPSTFFRHVYCLFLPAPAERALVSLALSRVFLSGDASAEAPAAAAAAAADGDGGSSPTRPHHWRHVWKHRRCANLISRHSAAAVSGQVTKRAPGDPPFIPLSIISHWATDGQLLLPREPVGSTRYSFSSWSLYGSPVTLSLQLALKSYFP